MLRLDDVQAYSWRDISIQMIRDAYKFNAPTVAWVIPEKLADDRRMVQFLKRENCNIELAMHGWNHFGTPSETAKLKYITEFWDIGYDEARDKIIKAKNTLGMSRYCVAKTL